MSGLRVLITNNTLSQYAGTQTYVRDLALGLLKRGHTPFVYTHVAGAPAQELRNATIPVVEEITKLTATPDLIHGHHNIETMTALLRFRGVPAVYFLHDSTAWHDVPPLHPRILRYVAIDNNCRDRMLYEYGVPEDRLCVLLNAVDLERFQPRPPLPVKPKRAIVFSNYAREGPHLHGIRSACEKAGLSLDVVGEGVNNAAAKPEEILGQYDLVFAKARCALEALAVGCAVVLCDIKGVGPLVTAADLDRLRGLNFGRRTLMEPVEAEVLVREICRYEAEDAAEVSRRIREVAGKERLLDAITCLYEEVREEYASAGGVTADEESRAEAAFMDAVGRRMQDYDRVRTEVEAYRNSAMMRIRNRLVKSPLLCRIIRRAAK